MSGGNQINNTGQTTQISSTAPANQPPVTQQPKNLLARIYDYVTSLPSMAAGAASGWIARVKTCYIVTIDIKCWNGRSSESP